jgi:hypothetical protein
MADVAAIVVVWRHQKPWFYGHNHSHGNVSLKYCKLEIRRTTCIRYLKNKRLRVVHGGYMTCMQKENLKALLYATVANWQFKWARTDKVLMRNARNTNEHNTYLCNRNWWHVNLLLTWYTQIGNTRLIQELVEGTRAQHMLLEINLMRS